MEPFSEKSETSIIVLAGPISMTDDYDDYLVHIHGGMGIVQPADVALGYLFIILFEAKRNNATRNISVSVYEDSFPKNVSSGSTIQQELKGFCELSGCYIINVWSE